MYDIVLPLIWSLHFWSPVVSSGQKATGSWLPPLTGNLCIVFLCFVCVWYLNDGNSVTILNQGCLSCLKNRRELSGCRNRPQVHLEKSRYQGNHWIHLSFTRFEKKLAVLRCTTTVYCILWPWMLIDGVGGIWGGWDRAVKTVCMWTVFCQGSDGVKLYLYYLFYVRVKLNSWHLKIEALFKQTGCSLGFFFF